MLQRDEQRAAPGSLLTAAESRRVAALTRGLRTKAARIRSLAAAGFDRSQIANALGLGYQHVYNVLSASTERTGRVRDGGPKTASAPAVAYPSLDTAQGEPDHDQPGPDPVRSTVAAGGRVTVPAAFLDALGVSEGDSVVLSLEGDEVRLYGPDAAIRRVQRLVARYVPADVSLADELISERRREAVRESDDG